MVNLRLSSITSMNRTDDSNSVSRHISIMDSLNFPSFRLIGLKRNQCGGG